MRQGGVGRVEGVGVGGGREECVGWRLKKQGGVCRVEGVGVE